MPQDGSAVKLVLFWHEGGWKVIEAVSVPGPLANGASLCWEPVKGDHSCGLLSSDADIA